ncbi:MAG: hypothetical protein ABIS38_03745 [Sphingomicrobium sp.]
MNRLAVLSSGGVAALAAGAAAAFLLMRGPPPSLGEEGIFQNDCCGTVTLAEGRLSMNGSQSVLYDVGRDAQGPFILPRTYVGAYEDVGFEVDGSQRARKLRLDHLPGPKAIELPMGTRAFVFEKKGPPVLLPVSG